MAELNELLEEASGKALELSQEASDAIESVHKLVGAARGLSERIDDLTQKGAQALEAVAARLDEAEGRLETEVTETGTEMDALGTRAGEVREGVGALLDAVTSALDDLKQKKADALEAIDQAHTASIQDAVDLDTEIQARATALSTDLDEARQAIAALQAAVAQAETELQQKQADWGAALQHMTAETEAHVEQVGKGFSDLLGRQTTALVDLGNHVITSHNQVMEDLKNKFAEGAKDQLKGPLEALSQKLEVLGQLGSSAKDALGQEADALLAKVAAALPLIEQVKATLALTGSLS